MSHEMGVHELTVSKVVPAPPNAVFDAWTDAESLAAWWRPPGGRCTGARMNVQVGGTYEIVNAFPDGIVLTITGEFLEVVAPESLTYTWGVGSIAESDQLVNVRFEPHIDGTLVTVRHERIPTVEARNGHHIGWHSCLDGLVAFDHEAHAQRRILDGGTSGSH